MKKAIQIMVSKINEMIIHKETTLNTFKDKMKEAEMKLNQQESQIKVAKRNIKESSEFLINLIKNREEELLANLEDIGKKQTNEYNEFVKYLEYKHHEVSNFINQANNDIKKQNLVFLLGSNLSSISF